MYSLEWRIISHSLARSLALILNQLINGKGRSISKHTANSFYSSIDYDKFPFYWTCVPIFPFPLLD